MSHSPCVPSGKRVPARDDAQVTGGPFPFVDQLPSRDHAPRSCQDGFSFGAGEPIRCDGSHGPSRTSHRSPRSVRAVPRASAHRAARARISSAPASRRWSREVRRQDGSPRWALYGLAGGADVSPVSPRCRCSRRARRWARPERAGAALRDDRHVVGPDQRGGDPARRRLPLHDAEGRLRRLLHHVVPARAVARRSWARGSTRRTRPGARPRRSTCRAR